jgi:YesN/AraC family two-component response regulator
MCFVSKEQFPNIKIRAIELAALIDRSAGSSPSAPSAANALRQVRQAESLDDLSRILFQAVDQIANQNYSFRGTAHSQEMRKAVSYIIQNYQHRIKLKEIAAYSGLSGPYFSTIFRDEMGETLTRYLNHYRVKKAAKLLLSTELPLTAIASSCGFEDQGWFSKIFRSFTGLGPQQYRKQGGLSREILDENSFCPGYLELLKKE